MLELQPLLQIPDALLAVYLEELSSTLASAAFKAHHGGPSATDLLHADLPTVERAMTEGHPSFVANNGRIGFGVDEHAAYSPEAGAPIRPLWLGVRTAASHLAMGSGLDEDAFYLDELGARTLRPVRGGAASDGEDPADYRYLPVHPWQWEHRVAVTFAPDVARRDLVPLGTADDDYAAQQSIRTLFNTTRPDRHYVKVALAIQNMGFLRGLSPAYMRATPAINDWVFELVSEDPTLAACGFQVLRERVSVGYTGDVYHRTPHPARTARCSPPCAREPRAAGGPTERLATMAALLHRDADGDAFVTALRAGVGAGPRGLGPPVPACLPAPRWCTVFCVHELAFMPHGENLILVLDGHAGLARAHEGHRGGGRRARCPPRCPTASRASGRSCPPTSRRWPIFTDVFDGVFRHLAAILDTDGVLPEGEFWALVRECVDEHAADHPGLRDRRRPARRSVRPLLPQPAAATQHPADGGSGRPVVVAHLRGHARQPHRMTVFRDALGVPHIRATRPPVAGPRAGPRHGARPRPADRGRPVAGGGSAGRADRGRRGRVGPVRAACAAGGHRAACLRAARRRGPRVRRRLRGGRERRVGRGRPRPLLSLTSRGPRGSRSGSCSSTTRCSRCSPGCCGTSTSG